MQEAERAHLNVQKTALESQMTTKRTEVNEAIQKLIGSVWPMLRIMQDSRF